MFQEPFQPLGSRLQPWGDMILHYDTSTLKDIPYDPIAIFRELRLNPKNFLMPMVKAKLNHPQSPLAVSLYDSQLRATTTDGRAVRMGLPPYEPENENFPELYKFYKSIIEKYPSLNLQRWFANGVMAQLKGIGDTNGYQKGRVLTDYLMTEKTRTATGEKYLPKMQAIRGLTGLDENERKIPIALSSRSYRVGGFHYKYEPSRFMPYDLPLSCIKLWDEDRQMHHVEPRQMGFGDDLHLELLLVPGGYCLKDLKAALAEKTIDDDWQFKYLSATSNNFECMDRPDGNQWNLYDPQERKDFASLLVRKAFYDSMIEAEELEFIKGPSIQDSNRTDHNTTYFGPQDLDDCRLINENYDGGIIDVALSEEGMQRFKQKIISMMIDSKTMDIEIASAVYELTKSVGGIARNITDDAVTMYSIAAIFSPDHTDEFMNRFDDMLDDYKIQSSANAISSIAFFYKAVVERETANSSTMANRAFNQLYKIRHDYVFNKSIQSSLVRLHSSLYRNSAKYKLASLAEISQILIDQPTILIDSSTLFDIILSEGYTSEQRFNLQMVQRLENIYQNLIKLSSDDDEDDEEDDDDSYNQLYLYKLGILDKITQAYKKLLSLDDSIESETLRNLLD